MKQTQNHSASTKVTRRALVGGAAAGTVALAAGDASAQRCPATPPVRAKGPPVWLDYDQQDMDELYDQSVFAFNQRHVLARSDANNAIATATIGKPERFAYGSDPVEGVDVWKTRKPNPPVLIYLHGGVGRAAARRTSRSMPSPTSMPVRILSRSISPMCARPRAICSRWSINAGARWDGRTATRTSSAAIPSGFTSAAARPAAISPAAWSRPTGRRCDCRAPSSKAR